MATLQGKIKKNYKKTRESPNGRWTKEYKAKWNKEWIANNRERYNASKYHYRDRLKLEVVLYYGKGKVACNHCGYDDIRALCLDHIDNDGAEWRKKFKVAGRGTTGTDAYAAVKKLGFPDGFQVLCANCNLIKEIELKMNNRLKNKWYIPMDEKGGGA